MSASFSADGRLTSTADRAGIGKVWEVATCRLIGELHGHQRDQRHPLQCWRRQAADSKRRRHGELWRLDGNTFDTQFVMRGHTLHIYKAVWSPDERFIATASQDYFIRLWKGAREAPTLLGTHTEAVYDVAFSPDGAYFMSGSEHGKAHIYGARSALLTDRLLSLTQTRITRPPSDLGGSGTSDSRIHVNNPSMGKRGPAAAGPK